jgi:hypothetical protein
MSEAPDNPINRALGSALYRIFRALARLCLRHGISYEAAAEIAKHAFVDVAYGEFVIAGRKQSASRVALLTGLHRKDVGRMMAAERPGDLGAAARVAYAARVIAGWRRDEHFADGRGAPAALPFDEGSPNFLALVKRHGGQDVPGRAVLDELMRVGAVTRLRDGRVKLVARGYVPTVASTESIAILGSDVSDLVATIDHNLSCEPSEGLFQRRVAYDNLPTEALDEIHGEVRRAGQALLERLDHFMARRDRDSNPKAGGTGRKRAMAGVYFFRDDVAPKEEKPS